MIAPETADELLLAWDLRACLNRGSATLSYLSETAIFAVELRTPATESNAAQTLSKAHIRHELLGGSFLTPTGPVISDRKYLRI